LACQSRKIPQCALIQLKLSPWQKWLELQINQAFITMMGFDANSFDRVLVKFGPMFFGHMPFDESGMMSSLSTPEVEREKFSLGTTLG
jgi:hypothetical protein